MSESDNQATDAMADEWAAAMEEQDTVESTAVAEAASAQFQQLEADSGTGRGDVQLDAILDVPVTISMEIGRTQISIHNLLQLNQGSVVELDRLAGEPMDVLVNGTLIAKGEVVVVNEKFGIRLTDIISPADRVKRLA
jgi:flagellar motor switch protein FliN/FliY